MDGWVIVGLAVAGVVVVGIALIVGAKRRSAAGNSSTSFGIPGVFRAKAQQYSPKGSRIGDVTSGGRIVSEDTTGEGSSIEHSSAAGDIISRAENPASKKKSK